MLKWHRPAATNTKLITVLVLAVLAAGIYWVVKMSSSGDDEVVVKQVDDYELWCMACREKTLIPAGEAKMRPRQGGKLQCPKCKEWAGTWGPPDSDGGVVAP